MFLTKGVGTHKEYLNSFEVALRDAGIEKYNLVTVSSIFPPDCKIITRAEGLKYLEPGQIVPVVMSRQSTNEPNRLIAASVGLALPAKSKKREQTYGYLSEHHSFGETEEKAGDYCEDMAAQMLATIMGLEFDMEKAYDERKDLWRVSGHTIHTRNITQSAVGNKKGLWTTVVAASVLIV
ncbi:MAG: arginine decarboxylase, pyruvoyl-dependent [Candidatus Wallbacteria bacterium]|nr:arginine decarboxylase, pyruvoyl-dependent [Candidatus Wallbacteria bacterium]MBI4868193.1 arginine decarboxylase, pyruvoyl-dependent [Candidatus Wallbacteria bacterium]